MSAANVSPARHTLTLSQQRTLLLLRVSLGLLMLVWGLDKIVNPGHGVKVAERFYFGLPLSAAVMPALGVVQIALGVLVMLRVRERVTLAVLVVLSGVTLIGVWRSIVDPWGWYLTGTNALFFPSLIIFAGAVVLLAFRER